MAETKDRKPRATVAQRIVWRILNALRDEHEAEVVGWVRARYTRDALFPKQTADRPLGLDD